MDLLKTIVARSPLLPAMRVMTRRFGRVLLYHRVVNDDCDPLVRGLLGGITQTAFRHQLDYLDKHYKVVTLWEMLNRIDHPYKLAAITFDDGYADNLYNALPLLEARRMPATIFVVAGFVGSGRRAWWNQLARMIIKNGPNPLRFETEKGVIDFPFRGSYDRQMTSVGRWLRNLSESRREALFADEFRCDEDRFLDPEEMKHLEQRGVKIEAHTVNHPRLSSLSAGEVAKELTECKSMLEQWLESPVRYTAYPYGRPGDFNRETMEAARRAGYEAAFAAGDGLVHAGVDRYAVPRIGTREHFYRFQLRVSRWRRVH
ncbi:MAG: polysaccharide deacetylase family protein [Candidatus Methylomirabilales bacterium]